MIWKQKYMPTTTKFGSHKSKSNKKKEEDDVS